jgi:hypothetical protein
VRKFISGWQRRRRRKSVSMMRANKCLFSMRQAASGGGSRAQRDKEFFPASEVVKAKSDMSFMKAVFSDLGEGDFAAKALRAK